MPQTGLKLESYSFRDHAVETIFGSAPSTVVVKPLNRDISGIPVVSQGQLNTCVSASITWVRMWKLKEAGQPVVDLSWPFLAAISNTGADGATPSQVLRPAHKTGICTTDMYGKGTVQEQLSAAGFTVKNYEYVTDYSTAGLYSALQRSVLAVGVKNFQGTSAHMVVAYDVTSDGLRLKCVNWWSEMEQSLAEIPFSDVEVAISFADRPETVGGAISIPFWTVLKDKLLMNMKKILAGILGVSSMAYGAGYTPVTDYDARTTSYISSSATTIPVNSTTDKAGNQISFSNISSSSTPYAFFTLEPGTTREEIIACSAVSATEWSSCLRGLPFQGGSMTPSTTLQYAHNAGSRMIMSDVGQFYGEFVSISGNQTIYDTKTFNTFPVVTSTTGVPTTAAQLATKYYVDQVGAGGFTAANIAAGYGLFALGTVPETVGIDISATSSGLYFSGIAVNELMIQTSSTGGLVVNGSGRLVVDTSDALTWTGTQTFDGSVTANGTITVPYSMASSSAASVGYTNAQFFGDGSDGVLNITSGTTTLNTAGKNVYQYSSVTIGGTAALTGGANLQNLPVYIFVSGDLTVTSTNVSAINWNGLGAASGDSVNFPTIASSTTGSAAATVSLAQTGAGGGGGGSFGDFGVGGTAGTVAGGAGGGSFRFNASSTIAYIVNNAFPGGLGGKGSDGRDSGNNPVTGGAGSAGGGTIIFIVGGNVNFTSAVSASGVAGVAGAASTNCGGGGGGAGGFFGIYYFGTLTAGSGTFTVTGGSGGAGGSGNGSASGNAGGAGGAGRSQLRKILLKGSLL